MRRTLCFSWKFIAPIGLMLAGAMLSPAQQGAPGKTAGQVYKNLQVLQDTPSTEFIAGMRLLATSLGVECEFCHLGDRSQDTPNKQTARKMMTMMRGLNQQNFNGRTEVTCYTCHKGSHDPVNAPVPTGQYSTEGPWFYKPTGAPVRGTDTVMADAYRDAMKKEQEAKAALPTAEQILDKYVTALGGEQALRSVTSRVITSATELSPNVRGTGPMVFVQQMQYFRAPNLYVTTFLGFNNRPTAKGFDGTNAWNQNANGVVTLTSGTALTRAQRDADFYESLNLKKEYTQLSVRGIEKVGNRDAYVVRGVPAGDNPESLYFDTQSGLLSRKGTFNTTALGNYTINTDYEDYRDVGGVKVPFLIRVLSVSPADTAVIHVEKVENNVAIDAGKFVKPASKQPADR